MLEARQFNLWYGDHQVLKDASVRMPERSVTAIIGPSGCGKSTLLRAFNRMHDLSPGVRMSGLLRVGDTDVNAADTDVVELRRRVGMVFQRPNPFPKSIFENVVFGLRMQGVSSRRDLELRAEECLKQVALWDEVKDRLHRSALALSGGQQQRLCIARCLAVQPDVLLMDEPASALDPVSTARLEELIVQLRRDYTIAVVTHNMQQATRISQHTAFLYQGWVVEYGETEQVFGAPRNPTTAEYIGGRFG